MDQSQFLAEITDTSRFILDQIEEARREILCIENGTIGAYIRLFEMHRTLEMENPMPEDECLSRAVTARAGMIAAARRAGVSDEDIEAALIAATDD